MREGSSEPGRGECFFVVEKTFRTRPTCFSGAALAGKIATSGLPAGLLATGLIIGALCIITACQRLSNPDGR